MNVLQLSKTAFWDIDFEGLDPEKNSLFVMCKVFNYGTKNDMIAVIKHYGIDRIRKEIVHGAYFKPQTLSFLCVILDCQASDFVAYQRRQNRTSNWQTL